MAHRQQIKLILVTGDRRSEVNIKSPHVTEAMIEAARDLIETTMTGERPDPKRGEPGPRPTGADQAT